MGDRGDHGPDRHRPPGRARALLGRRSDLHGLLAKEAAPIMGCGARPPRGAPGGAIRLVTVVPEAIGNHRGLSASRCMAGASVSCRALSQPRVRCSLLACRVYAANCGSKALRDGKRRASKADLEHSQDARWKPMCRDEPRLLFITQV